MQCLLTSTTSLSTKMFCPRPTLENIWLSLDLSVRTHNDWKTTHECWGWWSRWNMVNCGGSMILGTPNVIMQQAVFSLCGRLVGHFPVWLALCGLRSTQEESKLGYKGLG